MTNTLISYLYRDAHNYKIAADVVLEGALSPETRAAMLAHCDDETGGSPSFVPGQIDMRDLQFDFSDGGGFNEDVDHPFHELLEIRDTEDPVRINHPDLEGVTAAELAERFLATQWDWEWQPSKPPAIEAEDDLPEP